MDRRRFLLFLAAGVVGAALGHGADGLAQGRPAPAGPPRQPAARPAAASEPADPRPPAPTGVVSRLPGEGSAVALTIDDGTSSEVVGGYVTLARQTGIRLTFFPNGCYRSWTEHAPALRPLIESGQIAVGNHTWSHPDVTTLSDAAVAAEITRNQAFLRGTLGVGQTPFFRPPFGAHNARTDRIAADLGHPTIALWDGTLGDDRVIGQAELMANARQWFAAQHIVIGHANHPAVISLYGWLVDLISSRGLHTVTLTDVWAAGRAEPAAR